MLSEIERVYLGWMNRMATATRKLNEWQALSLSAWLASGEKRSTWPEWVNLIGARPPEPSTKKANQPAEILQRKAA